MQSTGSNTGVWGQYTNTNVGDLIEQALTYITQVTVSDVGDTTLTALNYQIDQSRSMCLYFQGTLTATRTVICPAVSKMYVLINATAQTVNLKCSGSGTSFGVPSGRTALVMCDGVTVVSAVTYTPSLSGAAISGSTLDSTPIGATTPSTAVFSGLTAATANINGGALTGVSIVNSTATLNSAIILSGSFNGTVGSVTPTTGAFTQVTSTIPTGNAPLVVASTTRVTNLNAAQAGFADTSTITDDVATNATFYPMFVAAASGNQAAKVSSSKMSYNPSTGALTLATPLATASGGTGNANGVILPRSVEWTPGTSASITPNSNTTDLLWQANTNSIGTLTINAPTGTPSNGQTLILRIRSTAVQTFSWNAIYRGSSDLSLPTVTTGGTKTDYIGFKYNSADTRWDLLAKVFGF
jgi:hypothetical protein